MEGNKDEAFKCLTIAKHSLSLGDYTKALRFAEKSIRLYPTTEGEQLIRLAKEKSNSSTGSSTTTQLPSKPSSPPTQQTTSVPAQERKYTAEQVRAVKSILACGKNYYKILSVEKTATDTEIKKAFRKQALQFHPDKNSAPGADEAFKLVAKAFDVLSDADKRAIHDQGGDADVNRARSSGYQQQHQHYAYNRRHGEEVSPEDLFNMFFGGGMRNNFGPSFRTQQQQRYRQQSRHRQQQRQQRSDEGNLSGISQMMPIILMILVAIFVLLFSFESDPLYTFYPSTTNFNLRHTKFNHINYYVNPNVFDTNIKTNKYKFTRTEKQIEMDWLSELRSACQSEQRVRSDLLAQADGMFFRNERAYRKAEKMKLEKCDELRRLGPKIRATAK